MALSCAISGEVPLEPVVSPVSGAVFEKRLIEKHLSTSPTDPVNGEPLTVEQLVVLKASKVVRPRPANATSVPVLLKLLQDEWDAGMLENFKMKQHVETVRQELSHALYQHDAACRVIARLTKERDQARQALAMLQATAPAAAEPQAMEADSTPADDVIGKLQAKADELSKTRKKRAKAAELATAEDIKAMGEKSSTSSIHSAGSPGISALDLHVHNNNIVATGGVDKLVHVYDHSAESIVSTFKGHSKKVTSVVLHPTADVGLSSSLDQTIAVWNTKNGESLSSITTHTKGVHSISLHPTGDYVLSASADKTWAFSDIHTGKTLSSTTGPAGLTSIEWHPDGIIFGSGTADNVVRIWDIKGPTFNIHNFEGHAGPVTAVAFSENGYYMASAAEDSTVKLWDLRKLVNFKTLDLAQGTVATSLHFDYSGVYLAVGGSDVSVFQTKTWDLINSFGTFSGAVTGVKFGKHARMLATASLDRSLKIFA